MTHQDNAPRRPRVLIEDWLPVKELGIESRSVADLLQRFAPDAPGP